MKTTKYLTIVVYTLAILFMVWVFFSFIEANSNNIICGANSAWNFFNILVRR